MTGYKNVFYVAPDANFEDLAHKGRQVDLVLVPCSRKDEFLKSSGAACLLPMLWHAEGQVLYYDDRERS
jgi:hypothetical protein